MKDEKEEIISAKAEETQSEEVKNESEEFVNQNVGEVITEEEGEKPLDKNVKLMSPMRMVLRRFFRSKLSVAGIIMLAALFAFYWGCTSWKSFSIAWRLHISVRIKR